MQKDQAACDLLPSVHLHRSVQTDSTSSCAHMATTLWSSSFGPSLTCPLHTVPTHEAMHPDRFERGGLGQSCAGGDDDPLPVGREGEGGEQDVAALHADLPPHPPLSLHADDLLQRSPNFCQRSEG